MKESLSNLRKGKPSYFLYISRNSKNDSANRLKITIYSLGLVSKASVLNY